jgi:hypothetical protein
MSLTLTICPLKENTAQRCAAPDTSAGRPAKHWRTTPLPDREGVRGILEDLAAQELKAKTADPDNFIDPTFVRKVSQEGLIDKLLGAKK